MLFNRFVKTFVYYKLYKINKHCSAFKVNNIIRGNIKLLSTNRILNNIIHDKGVEYHGPIVWPIIDVNNSDVNNSDVNNSDVNNSDVNNSDVNNSDVNNSDVNNSDVNNIYNL